MSTVPAVRAFIRARGRRRRGWTDRYTAVFGLAMAAVVLAEPASRMLAAALRPGDPSRAGAGVALLLLVYAGLLAAARVIGPVVPRPADAAWLLLSPLDRRGVLGRPAGLLLAVSAAAGAVLGVGALAVLGAPDLPAVRLAAAAVLGIAAATGGAAAAVLAQASREQASWTVPAAAAATVLTAAVVLSSSAPGHRLLSLAASAPPALGAALAGLSAVPAAALVRRAWAALERIPARTLLAASTRAGRAAAVAAALDPGVVTWAAEEQHWRGRVLRSRPWPALPAPSAVAWQDWRRLARRPWPVAVLAAVAALPALAAGAIGSGPAGAVTDPAASTAVGTAVDGSGPLGTAAATAADAMAGGLVVAGLVVAGALAAALAGVSGARRDASDPALARMLGTGPRRVLAARALLPGLLGAAWLVLALAGLTLSGALPAGPWWLLGALAAPASAAGALRAARRPPPDHALPVIDTPMGVIPTGPIIWALTGIDLAVLGSLPLIGALASGSAEPGGLLAAQALLGAAVLAGFLLRSGRREAG
ncbi:hypothetical protein GCM10010466_12830 [Planomonospora alba]|uniref:ABC-2 type transport system permease protein n=1 Tax=Planomonospora alba TaxID=161354 RepID=A0ABP6MWD2_9ACTN